MYLHFETLTRLAYNSKPKWNSTRMRVLWMDGVLWLKSDGFVITLWKKSWRFWRGCYLAGWPAALLEDIDPILQKQWNSLGFINILKSWTHIKFRKAWNSLCFIDILKLGFPSSFENHWNSLRFIDISCGLLVFLLKNVEKPVLFWCFLVVASIWSYYYSSKWIWPRHKTSFTSTLYWGIASYGSLRMRGGHIGRWTRRAKRLNISLKSS